jgi:diguanylate cyclase (GGDEF)-like protein
VIEGAPGKRVANTGSDRPEQGSSEVRDVVLFTRVALARILGGARRFAWETERTGADGRSVCVRVTARPLVQGGQVVGIIEGFEDALEDRLSRDTAQRLATHDVLTGLPNRLLLSDRLKVAIAQAERGHLTPALLFCDIDDFKAVNDTWGHAVGDEVLRHVATSITAVVRKADTVARYGGDEIVVLLPDVRICAQAELVAAKILERLRIPKRHLDATLAISMSIGITLLRGKEDAESLLRRADAAMYEVKHHGGDGYRVAVE